MEPREFFDQVREAYAAADAKSGSVDVDLDLAGRAVRVSFASGTLHHRLSRALAHRVRPGQAAAEGRQTANLLVWDSTSSGVMPPSPPWGPNDYRQKGYIRGFNRDGIHTSYHVGPGVLSMYDDESDTGIYWTAHGAGLPDYQIGSPLLIVLQWWADAHQIHLVHAGSVGTDDGGILLVGSGGSGKSTTALSCVDAPGFGYVSDDYCLLETGDGDQAHSLYSSGKLDERSLTILPHFRALAANQDRPADEKALLFLAECKANRLEPSFDLKAIVCPKTSGRDFSSFTKTGAATALRALAPSTIFQLTGAGSHTFQAMARLARRLPCYELHLSRHMRDVPSAIAEILRQAS